MATIMFAAALPVVAALTPAFEVHADQPAPASRAVNLSPTESVRQTIDSILKILNDTQYKDPARKQERLKMLEDTVSERFDYPEMSKRVLGAQWKKLDAARQDEFVSLFQQFLSANYAGKVEEYSGETIKYVGERIADRVYAEVGTSVAYRGSTVPINYRLMNKGGEWRAYDVVIDGVSMVNNYRSQFDKIIRSDSYDSLLQQLRDKNRKNDGVAAAPSAPVYMAGTKEGCC